MSYEVGAIRYFLATFKHPVMFLSMYAFGSTIIASIKWFITTLIFLNNLDVNLLISMIIAQLLPPTILDVILNTVVGAVVASLKWYFAVR